MDITSPDLYVSDSINFGIKVVKNWQKRTIWQTTTKWTLDKEWSGFLNGVWQNGYWSGFQWWTMETQIFTVDKLDNFFLEILGVAWELDDDDDETDWYTTFDAGFNSTYGYTYGVNLISLADLIKSYNPNITANDLMK